MGQRVYKTVFNSVTVAAAQDLFSIKAGAANGVELHSVDLSAASVTAPAEINIVLKRFAATVTQGSGGTVPNIFPADSGDTKAATAVVHANDTTIATTSGSNQAIGAFNWNVLLPFQYLPPPEDRDVCQAAEAFCLTIGAPASTVISGTIVWRELP